MPPMPCAHLAALPVDVLFTDINLPGGMDGAALARRAREMQPQLPVVYASARATLLKQDARVPGSIVVPKPYEPAWSDACLPPRTKRGARRRSGLKARYSSTPPRARNSSSQWM